MGKWGFEIELDNENDIDYVMELIIQAFEHQAVISLLAFDDKDREGANPFINFSFLIGYRIFH